MSSTGAGAGAHSDTDAPAAPAPWLAVIDMQQIFAEPESPWATPRFAEVVGPITTLVAAFRPRVCFTRFVAPKRPAGAWIDYYATWPFALLPDDAPELRLVDAFAREPGLQVASTTFGKWTPELASAVPLGGTLVLAGVSTDCCVLSTALAAGDAGIHVKVVADACAGVDDVAHDRALQALALYRPLIEVVAVADVLTQLGR